MSTQPMRAASATPKVVTFAWESTSANQEPVVMVVRFDDPNVQKAWHDGLASPHDRDRVWAAHSECVECQKRIGKPSEAAMVATVEGPRVVCKRPCFVSAMQRLNPTFSKRAARARSEAR